MILSRIDRVICSRAWRCLLDQSRLAQRLLLYAQARPDHRVPTMTSTAATSTKYRSRVCGQPKRRCAAGPQNPSGVLHNVGGCWSATCKHGRSIIGRPIDRELFTAAAGPGKKKYMNTATTPQAIPLSGYCLPLLLTPAAIQMYTCNVAAHPINHGIVRRGS